MDPSAPCDRSTAVPMTRETLAGNTVVLEIAPDTFAVYAHLLAGSIQVVTENLNLLIFPPFPGDEGTDSRD